jgi:hypothetical protein
MGKEIREAERTRKKVLEKDFMFRSLKTGGLDSLTTGKFNDKNPSYGLKTFTKP